MGKLQLLGAFVFTLPSFLAHAENPANVKNFIDHKDWSFVENKGQLTDRNGTSEPDIKFYGHQGGISLYCKPGAISFVFSKSINSENTASQATEETSFYRFGSDNIGVVKPSTVAIQQADLVLLNSNPNSQIIAAEQQGHYENFFLSRTPETGITGARTYKTITYKEVYPHIDLVLHAKREGMKYEFIIYAGGNVGDIQIQWNGLQNLELNENGSISYALEVGTMEENKPVSYLGKRLITSYFVKKDNNIIGFNVAGYDKSQTLVIDPSLSWATYFGGGNIDEGTGVAVDGLGNVYMSGYTGSTSGIATSGAYLTSNLGDVAFLSKFSSSGALIWATYFGGGDEVSQGLATDNSGDVYMTGYTYSTSGIATTGAYQTSYGGAIDVFLVKFNSSGSRLWGTYFGGSGLDQGNGIATDSSGNVYITGETSSTAGVASSGAYQTSYGGSADAFLAKFNSSGIRQWSTYYGGSSTDYAHGIASYGTDNIYIEGSTGSKTAIATNGAYQTALASFGSNDVFLAKFNGNGTQQWGTYFGGPSDDEGYGVAVDGSGNVYITGYTGSATGISTSGTYQTAPLGGGTDGFLAGFSSGGMRKWGTYYGGINADYCYGIGTDNNDNIYVTGLTYSTKGGIATSGAYQSSFGGNGDAFISKFKNNGTMLVGSYYGGRLLDQGTGVAAFNNGNVFITGYTASDTGIATSGAFQSSNASTKVGKYDAFLASFNFVNHNDAGVVSILSPTGSFCPGPQFVKVKIENYGLDTLKKASINWSVNKKNQTVFNWTGSLAPDSAVIMTIGTFNFLTGIEIMRAWTSKPNGVTDSTSANDSAMIADTGYVLPQASVIPSTAICSGGSISIGNASVSGDTYSWSSIPSGFSSSLANPSVSPTGNTIYILSETNTSGCINTHSDTISLPVANPVANTSICMGTSVSIGEISYKGNNYYWTSVPIGFTSTLANPVATPTVNTTYYLKDSIAGGCSKTGSVFITVNPLPGAPVIPSTAICPGNSISIGSASVTGHTYSWTSSPLGFNSTLSNPSVSPAINTVYNLKETITATGCSKIHSDTISLPSALVIANRAICLGSSISIGSTSYPGHYYSWTSVPVGFSSTLANPNVSPNDTTTYYLKDSVVTGCVGTDSVYIIVNPLPTAIVLPSTAICPGTSISIGGPKAIYFQIYTYLWTTSSGGVTSTVSFSANPLVSPSTTTIYNLKVSIPATTCTRNYSDTISLPAANIISDTTICPGTSISLGGEAYKGDSYFWTSNPPGFTSTLANPTVKPGVTTTYYLSDSVSFGSSACNAYDSVTVIVNPAAPAIVLASTAICSGAISIGAVSTAGHTYSWTSSPPGFTSTSSNPTVSPSVTTAYSLTETITATGCSITHSDTISIPSSASIIANTAICAGTTISIGGQSNSGNIYSWKSSPKGFTSSEANPKITPLASATYYFKDTAAAGCKKTDSVTVVVNPLPASKTIANSTICMGTPTPIGAATVAGNQYSWTSEPKGFVSTISNPYANPNDTTTYYLKETILATGCSKTDSLTLTVNPLPAASILANTIICPGASVSIGTAPVKGNYYSWTSSNSVFTSNLASPSVSPSKTTYYTLIEEVIATGCSRTNTDTISVATATVASNTAICAGSSISIGGPASKGSNYTWTSIPHGFSSMISNPTVSPITTTTYSLKDSISGCVNTSSIIVAVNPLPSAETISNTTICAGNPVSLGATAVSGSKYNWTSVPKGFTSTLPNPTVNPNITTTYYLTETVMATGCSKTDSVIIKVNPLPSASVVTNTAICSGSSLSIGNLAVTGDTYSWISNPSGFASTLSNPSVTPVATTIYLLTETISATGCSNTHAVTISLPSASVIANTAVCLGSSMAIGGPSYVGNYYSWTSSPAGFTSTSSNPLISPSVSTTYYLKDSVNGCSKTSSVNISINPLPSASVITPMSVCSGSSISLGAAPVSGDTYSWTSVPSGFASTLSNPSASQSKTTTYTLTETISATGCKNANSVKISTNPLPSASVIASTVICPATSIAIGAASVTGNVYSWMSFPSGFISPSSNPLVNPTVTTVYTLTETIASTGCSATHSDTISMPSAKIIADTVICSGSPISIGGASYYGISYSWTSTPQGFNSTSANPSVTPKVTTTYYLNEILTAGCKLTDSVIVSVNQLPAAKVIANTTICSGSSISIGAASVSGSIYSWTSSPSGFSSTLSNPSASPTVKTAYILTETSTTTGCNNTHSDTIFMPAAVVAANATICAGKPVSLGGPSFAGDTYSWTSSPAGFTSTLSNPTVKPTITTTYTLKDSVPGCKKSGNVTITVNPLPAAKVIAGTVLCSVSSVSLGDAAVSGNTYSWISSPSGFTSTSSNPSVSPTTTTKYTLTETIIATGCSNTHSDTILVPSASIVASTTICSGNAISIGETSYPGNLYSWTSSPAGFTSTLANPVVSPNTTITYNFKDSVAGCNSQTASVKITVNPSPAAKTISNATTCAATTIAIGGIIVPGDKYNWTSSPAGFTSTSPNPIVNPSINTKYYLTETIPNIGCSKTDSVTITTNPLPSAFVAANTVICGGTSISVGAAAVIGDSYSWISFPSGFTSTSSNPSVDPTVTTTYILTETIKATGCSRTNYDTVRMPFATIVASSSICQGSSISIGGTAHNGNFYNWTSSPPGFTSTLANPMVSPAVATKYYATDSISGCKTIDSVTIGINLLPTVAITPNTTICAGSTISIGTSPSGLYRYSWTSSPPGINNSSSGASVSPLVNTTYTLTETVVSTGCKNSASVTIYTNPLPSRNSIIASNAICSGSSISIGAAAVTGDKYSWTSFPSGFASTSSNPSVSPTTTTLYILKETIIATGCTRTDSDTISVPVASIVANTAICGGTPISIGEAYYKGNVYSWTSSPPGFTSTLANPTVSPYITTTYYFKDSVLNGCSKTDSIKIIVSPEPNAQTIANTAICPGSAISIGANAVTGSSYLWSSSQFGFSSSSSNPSVSPTKTTSYYLTEKILATSCSKRDTVIISVPSAAVASNATICAGASIALGSATSNKGDIYSWTSIPKGFTSTLANPIANPTTTTTYTLTDSIPGCKTMGAVTITTNPLPAGNVIPSTSNCSGIPISIGATALTGNTYSWTSSPAGFTSTSANPSVNPSLSTIYTLTEKITATGCSKTNSDTIFLPIVMVANDTIVCGSTAVSIGKTFTPFIGNYYSWTSSPAGFTSTLINPIARPGVPTTYYFKDSLKGCIKIDSVKISVNPLPAAHVLASTSLCSGSLSIGAAAVGGDTYSWTSSPSGFTSTSSNPTVIPSGTTVYFLMETNPITGCSKINSDTISFSTSTSVIANTAICPGSFTAIGGISYPGNTYSWTSSPAGFTSAVANPLVSPTVKTTYYLKDSVSPGCKQIDSVTLTINSLPVAQTASNATVCSGSSIAIGSVAVPGNAYNWSSSPSGFGSTLSNPTINPKVSTTYYLTETIGATGCSKTDSVIISANPLPAASVAPGAFICNKSFILIGTSPVNGNKYSWKSSPPGFNSVLANPIVSPGVKTTYTLTDTVIATGCSNTNSVTISVNPLPAAAVVPDNAICYGSFIPIGATVVAGDKYNWISSPSGFAASG